MGKDIIDQLLEGADRIDELSRSELQVLLRKAALDIETLRKLVGVRDEVWLETTKQEGNG